MNQADLLSELHDDSLRISSSQRLVRVDDELEASERTYLSVNGTPQAYRWLATLLNQLANTADKHACGTAVIVSPHDLKQLTMTEWWSLELECCQRGVAEE